MKLLILGSKEYPWRKKQKDTGGIDFYNEDLVNALSNKLNVSVIVRNDPTSLEKELVNNTTVYRVNWVPGFWTKTPTFVFNSFLLATKLNFDVILTHGPIATFFGIFLSKLKRKPLVAIPHGLASSQKVFSKFKKIGLVLERWTFERPNKVIALSKNDVVRIRQLSRRIRVELIPTGVDIEKFRSGNKERIQQKLNLEKQITILSTGRLIAVKGLNFLVDAAKKLKGNYRILLFGVGPQEQELRDQVKRLNLEKNIKFLGFDFRDEPDLLAFSDIFVLPSLSEGLPVGLLRAMVAGKPCVVTDVGLPVENNKTALVIPPKNAEELAKALQKLIDNRLLREQLGNNAYEYISQFTWENCANQFVALFEKLITNHQATQK